MGLPLWAVALFVAALAPFAVGYVADVMARTTQRRTTDALDVAKRASKSPRKRTDA